MKFLLTNHQIDRVSEILGNLGLIPFAAMIVPEFVTGQKDQNLIISGIVLGLSFWMFSLLILKLRREENND